MMVLMMLIGAAIVYWLLQTIYGRMWNKKLTTQLYFSTAHAVAGDTVELVEIVTNKKALPIPYMNVKFQIDRSLNFGDGSNNAKVSDKVYRNDIFSLLMYQRVTRKIPVVCAKRGFYRIDKVEMVSAGMFMNEVLVANCPQKAEIVVYPETADTEFLQVAFSKAMGVIEKNRHLYEDPFAFRGIRDYEMHDAMNTINWKASARTGCLMVNQYNETMCQEVCILLNLEPHGMMKYDMLSEVSISIAAGLAQMFIEQGIEVSMISNGRDVAADEEIKIQSGSGFAHINGINTLLARIDLSKDMCEFSSLLAQVKAENSDRENILYIMISQSRREDLQRQFERLSVHPAECMWIVPYHMGMETNLDLCSAQCVEWEVAQYAG